MIPRNAFLQGGGDRKSEMTRTHVYGEERWLVRGRDMLLYKMARCQQDRISPLDPTYTSSSRLNRESEGGGEKQKYTWSVSPYSIHMNVYMCREEEMKRVHSCSMWARRCCLHAISMMSAPTCIHPAMPQTPMHVPAACARFRAGWIPPNPSFMTSDLMRTIPRMM
jgi:hypothetical protein